MRNHNQVFDLIASLILELTARVLPLMQVIGYTLFQCFTTNKS